MRVLSRCPGRTEFISVPVDNVRPFSLARPVWAGLERSSVPDANVNACLFALAGPDRSLPD